MIRAGREATMLYRAWKTTGADAYRLYNELDESYVPLRDPKAPPHRPPFPERVRAFIYACANYAREEELDDLGRLTNGIAKAMAG